MKNGLIIYMNYRKTLDEILLKNGGFITYYQARIANINPSLFKKFIIDKSLIKQAPGFYSEDGWEIDLYFLFQYRFPKYIFSFFSSLHLLNLLELNEDIIEVTGPTNYRPTELNNPGVVFHTSIPKTYELGITTIKTRYGNTVKAYNLERTICNFLKNKNKFSNEIYLKIIKILKKNYQLINFELLKKYGECLNIKNRIVELDIILRI